MQWNLYVNYSPDIGVCEIEHQILVMKRWRHLLFGTEFLSVLKVVSNSMFAKLNNSQGSGICIATCEVRIHILVIPCWRNSIIGIAVVYLFLDARKEFKLC